MADFPLVLKLLEPGLNFSQIYGLSVFSQNNVDHLLLGVVVDELLIQSETALQPMVEKTLDISLPRPRNIGMRRSGPSIVL